jgi:hypothetical protein
VSRISATRRGELTLAGATTGVDDANARQRLVGVAVDFALGMG